MNIKTKIKKLASAIIFSITVSMCLFSISNIAFAKGANTFSTNQKIIAQTKASNCKDAFKNGRLCIPKPSTLPGPVEEKQNPTYLRDVLIVSVTRTLVSIVGGLSLLFFIIGGVQMLIAFGNDGTLEASKKTLTWSIIGFLIALFSVTIINIIGNIELEGKKTPQTQTSTQNSPAPPKTNPQK